MPKLGQMDPRVDEAGVGALPACVMKQHFVCHDKPSAARIIGDSNRIDLQCYQWFEYSDWWTGDQGQDNNCSGDRKELSIVCIAT